MNCLREVSGGPEEAVAGGEQRSHDGDHQHHPHHGGLALSRNTQARLARAPYPHHLTANPGCQPLNHHLANATTLPHHMVNNASNQGSAANLAV